MLLIVILYTLLYINDYKLYNGVHNTKTVSDNVQNSSNQYKISLKLMFISLI